MKKALTSFNFSTIVKAQDVISQAPANLNFQLVKDKQNKNKDCLITMHGVLGSLTNFRSIVRNNLISKKVDSYLLDMRNHGLSEHRKSMSIPEMAFDVANFINSKQLESIYLLGHSMGGRVAMCLLKNYPQYQEKIKGVIIVDIGPGNYFTEKNSQVMESWIQIQQMAELSFKNKSLKKIEQEISRICNNPKVASLMMTNIIENINEPRTYSWKINIQGIRDAFIDIIDYSIEECDYRGPIKIICGEKSNFMNQQRANEFTKIFPHCDKEKDIIFIKGAGHWVHSDKPHDFINELSQFIELCQNKKIN